MEDLSSKLDESLGLVLGLTMSGMEIVGTAMMMP